MELILSRRTGSEIFVDIRIVWHYSLWGINLGRFRLSYRIISVIFGGIRAVSEDHSIFASSERTVSEIFVGFRSSERTISVIFGGIRAVSEDHFSDICGI